MKIVDSHCHLDMLTDYDNISDIVARAGAAGVSHLQTICTKISNFENILSIAKKYPNIYASVGVHPSEISIEEDVITASELIKLSDDEKVIGLGETGLDYFYNKDEKQLEKQRESFRQHIMAAQSNGLPVIIHTRDAEDDTIDIISSMQKQAPFPALIHCFTSSKDFARSMLDMGLYISISGIVTFKNAKDLQEAVKFIPLDRMLVETDSPYLAPVPMRGKTNEPSYTKYVVEFISALKGISATEVATQTTNNFFHLFKKSKMDGV